MMQNLFLFTGEETYFLREKVNAWKKAFKEKHGDINMITLDAEEISPAEMIMHIEAAPFLGEKRLILIENLPIASDTTLKEKDEKALEKFEKSLEGIPETSVVVFIQPSPDKRRSFYKSLIKKAKTEEFQSLSGPALNQWIMHRVSKKGSVITAAAADYLITLAGTDLWRLANEIEKLLNFKAGQEITNEDIEKVVAPTLEGNIFHLTDALGNKDYKKAIRNLHHTMAAGEDLRQVFYMIVRQFRLLLQIQSYKQDYPLATPVSIASGLNLHPFVVRNVLHQIPRFKTDELKKAHGALLTIDIDLKSSRIRVTNDDQDELALRIERFVLEFCS